MTETPDVTDLTDLTDLTAAVRELTAAIRPRKPPPEVLPVPLPAPLPPGEEPIPIPDTRGY